MDLPDPWERADILGAPSKEELDRQAAYDSMYDEKESSGCFGSMDLWHLKRRQIPKDCSAERCLVIKQCWRKSLENNNMPYVDYRTDYGKNWGGSK